MGKESKPVPIVGLTEFQSRVVHCLEHAPSGRLPVSQIAWRVFENYQLRYQVLFTSHIDRAARRMPLMVKRILPKCESDELAIALLKP